MSTQKHYCCCASSTATAARYDTYLPVLLLFVFVAAEQSLDCATRVTCAEILRVCEVHLTDPCACKMWPELTTPTPHAAASSPVVGLQLCPPRVRQSGGMLDRVSQTGAIASNRATITPTHKACSGCSIYATHPTYCSRAYIVCGRECRFIIMAKVSAIHRALEDISKFSGTDFHTWDDKIPAGVTLYAVEILQLLDGTMQLRAPRPRICQ